MAVDLVVLSFNIRTGRGLDGRNSWWLRRRAVVETIESVGPDVAGLQEVRRLQLGYLRGELPGYAFLSAGRANGKARGEHCPVLYRRDRFDVADWDVRWFSENRSGRIATIARLVDRATGAPLAIVSTHLDYRSAAARTASAAALATWARAWPPPTVLLGDFNATAVDPSVANLLATGFRDALAHLPPQGRGAATAHRFSGTTDGRRIDHVLVAGCEVVDAGIVSDRHGGRLPSDHWPVVARLRLPQG